MNNKPSITYLILIIAPLFFGCGGPVKEKNKNNASANTISLHIGRYKSGKFFDNLKDQAIADSIELNMKIVAKK